MTKPVIKPSDFTFADTLVVVYPTLAVSFIPAFVWPYVQRRFCPSDALLAGYVETTIGVGGAAGITAVVCFFIFMGLVMMRKAVTIGVPPPRLSRRVFAAVCTILALLALAFWLNIFSSYVCIGAKGISLHSNPFEKPATYAWSDIRWVTPVCRERGLKQMTETILKLELAAKDGRTATLGFLESSILPRHAELKAAFISLPRNPDWRRGFLKDISCPKNFNELFNRDF